MKALLDLSNGLELQDSSKTAGAGLVGWGPDSSAACCSWTGVACDDLGRVVGLDLSNKSLHGVISSSVASLDGLEALNLSRNSLRGAAPEALARLPRLRVLDLSANALSGPFFPAGGGYDSGGFPALEQLNISSNGFDGPHPRVPRRGGEPGPPPLEVLRFSRNAFSGELPGGLSRCTALVELSLDGNQLTGNIPGGLYTLPRFRGSIPDVFGGMRWLESVNLASNGFDGELPASLSSCRLLRVISLRNNSLSACTELRTLNLARNRLVGGIPDSFKDLRSPSQLWALQKVFAVKSSMHSIWAVSLYILLGSADSITAYSLIDNSQLTRQIYQSLLGFSFVNLIIASTLDFQSNSGALRALPLLLVMAAYSVMQRLGARRLASASWNLNKMVAEYMYQEHTMGEREPQYDPSSMTGYHYLVYWPLVFEPLSSDYERTDIEMVWRHNDNHGRPLSPDLKDACLSFSLFHLLRRRFFGFECAESPLPKTRDLVFKGLLAKKKQVIDGAGTCTTEVDYDWVFKVIEVELDFMYDFFFTMYASPFYGYFQLRYLYSLVLVILIAITAFLTARGLLHAPSANHRTNKQSVILDTTATNVGITLLILGCIAFLKVVQMLHGWTNIWHRVSFACDIVQRKGGRWMGFRQILVKIGVFVSSRPRWYHGEEKLGQYSLLAAVSHHSNQSKVTKSLGLCLGVFTEDICTNGFLLLQSEALHPDRDRPLGLRKTEKPKELPLAVKKALVQSLERTQGKLANGESSLLPNGADDLVWACRLGLARGSRGTSCSQKEENQVYIILVWHIATCYCEKELAGAVTEECKEHHEAATILSKYCAYLVVSAPKLLPGHHCDTSLAFEEVVKEAMSHQSAAGTPEEEDSVYQKGLKLGEQLKNMEATHCWKVMVDFWAEMLLYLAPSENVKELVEHLAKGGEFITHLWALLTHAGILNRGESNVIDIENRGVHHPSSPGNGDQPASRGSCVQPGTQENVVQTVDGAPDACTSSSMKFILGPTVFNLVISYVTQISQLNSFTFELANHVKTLLSSSKRTSSKP
ncbi:hypothetical protein U9M48_011386 [Paspalum notatum var. saurae]|uniref:DUF4220 domain-containing protein n=1 Tax=Paspalum notatum var. saurae TaxID=547442 RepID=A0AAQ3WHH0_PASNO